MGREGHLHRAIFNREAQLRDQYPNSQISLHIDDDYPRGSITVEKEESMVRKEFFESAESVAALSLDEEYLDALDKAKSVAIHLPGMSFSGTYLVEMVTDLHIKAYDKGMAGKLKVDGFLYDFYGKEEQVA